MTKKEQEFIRKKDLEISSKTKDKDEPFFHDEFHEKIKKLGKGKECEK